MVIVWYGRGLVLGGFVSRVKWGLSENLGKMKFAAFAFVAFVFSCFYLQLLHL